MMKYEKPRLVDIGLDETEGKIPYNPDCVNGSVVHDTCVGGSTVNPGCNAGGLPSVSCGGGGNF